MRTIAMTRRAGLVLAALAACLPSGPLIGADRADLPYVYTEWKQFTVKDGLPDDHIFAVEVQGSAAAAWPAFSGGRFDHWHQLNSGLVNDVVYGVAIENDNVWAATTAGASRYNTKTGEWTIYTEKNAPMEEIWNYGVSYGDGKVYLAVWGSGVLEFDIATERWKDYLDPDGEMEIDLYRDDGIVHVITTGVSYVDGSLWVGDLLRRPVATTAATGAVTTPRVRPAQRLHQRGQGRSATEAWFSTDKGLGVLADFETDTWVTYTRDPEGRSRGKAVVSRERGPGDRSRPA